MTRTNDAQSGFSLLSKHKIWTAAALAAVIVVAIGLGYQLLNGSTRNTASASAATFVGSETYAGCHRAQAELWRPSQHRLAMQHATDKTVLGDFNDASFDYYGVQSRFFFICKGRYSRLHLSVILCLSRANAGVPS